MNRWTKRCMAFVLTLTIICTSMSAVKPTVETTYAATVQNITKSTTVVCRKTVAVKAPSGYKNCKYSSTNPKVASIDAKGKLKALRLGITTITVKSGTKKKSYTITVVPEKKSDVRLNQELILGGQMVQLKLVSDKYDTSQVKLYVDSAFKEIDHRGNCNFKKYNGYQASGSLYYSYGQFTRNITLYICDKDVIFDGLIENSQAGVNYDADSLQWEFLGKSFHYKQLKIKASKFRWMAVHCRIRLFILREIIHLLLLPEKRYIAKN